jgi:MraZ protein
MFSGASHLSVDAKGRLAIPTRYRDALAAPGQNAAVITADPSGCLLLFPIDAWTPFEARVSALPNLNPRVKALQRMWLGYRSDLEIDNAGRVLISPELREYAKFDRKVQMIGQGDRFELWSERGWQEVIELAQRTMREDPPAELAGFSV